MINRQQLKDIRKMYRDWKRFKNAEHAKPELRLEQMYRSLNGYKDFTAWLSEGFEDFIDAVEEYEAGNEEFYANKLAQFYPISPIRILEFLKCDRMSYSFHMNTADLIENLTELQHYVKKEQNEH